jgi:RNA polymerase sigma-70 factor, ECF subfamily
MDQKTDAAIVARVLRGDRSSYALLVDAYKGPVFNLALRMTQNREDADDLTQEIFIRAYQQLNKFNLEKKFFTWLYTIGINLIRNHLKKKALQVLEGPSLNEVEQEEKEDKEGRQLAEESHVRLEKAMQQLPMEAREAIILKFQQGLTFEEIAEMTGDSISAVKMRIYRGLDRLKLLIQ